jgi:hypothetical protein
VDGIDCCSPFGDGSEVMVKKGKIQGLEVDQFWPKIIENILLRTE